MLWVQLLPSGARHTPRSIQEKSAPKRVQLGTGMGQTSGRPCPHAGTRGRDQNVKSKTKRTPPPPYELVVPVK